MILKQWIYSWTVDILTRVRVVTDWLTAYMSFSFCLISHSLTSHDKLMVLKQLIYILLNCWQFDQPGRTYPFAWGLTDWHTGSGQPPLTISGADVGCTTALSLSLSLLGVIVMVNACRKSMKLGEGRIHRCWPVYKTGLVASEKINIRKERTERVAKEWRDKTSVRVLT